MLTFFDITVYLMRSWTWLIFVSVLLWDVHYQWRRWNKSFIPCKFIHSSLNVSGATFDVCAILNGRLSISSLLPFIQFHPCTICSELFFDIVLTHWMIVSRDCPAELHPRNKEKLRIYMDAFLYSFLARCNEDYPGVSSMAIGLGKSMFTSSSSSVVAVFDALFLSRLTHLKTQFRRSSSFNIFKGWEILEWLIVLIRLRKNLGRLSMI